MASSPLSAPGTPRTASPFSSEEEPTRPFSSSLGSAHSMAAHVAQEVHPPTSAPASASMATAADEAVDSVSKGKEKAVKGPLRLLDLPVDVLKDIIHQVHLG